MFVRENQGGRFLEVDLCDQRHTCGKVSTHHHVAPPEGSAEVAPPAVPPRVTLLHPLLSAGCFKWSVESHQLNFCSYERGGAPFPVVNGYLYFSVNLFLYRLSELATF